jgi:hypothetical protein
MGVKSCDNCRSNAELGVPTLLFTHPTSTTLFPVLSKLTISVLSFEDLMDKSNVNVQCESRKMKVKKIILKIFHR